MITAEMVETAMITHGKKRTNEIQMRAALEAVEPMIRNATIEEAAKVVEACGKDYAVEWRTVYAPVASTIARAAPLPRDANSGETT